MSPTPILYIINSLPRLGPVNVLEGIIRHIDRELYAPNILCLRSSDSQGNEEVFRKLGVSIHHFNASLWELELFTGRVADRASVLAREVNAALIHTHGYHPDLVASRMRGGYKRVSTQHNISLEDFTFSKGKCLGRYMHLRLWRALGQFDTLVGISQHVTEYAESLATRSTATVLNGVDTDKFAPVTQRERINLRESLGIEPDAYIWCMCGCLSNGKDPLLVIRAFVTLVAERAIPSNSHLVILGRGALEGQCRLLIKGLEDRVHLLGFTPEAHRYVAMSDCLVTASHSEGFGLNVAEALCCGIPVIATNLPPFREILAHIQDLELSLFSVGDSYELANQMLKTMNRRLSEEQTAQARGALSAERMSRDYMLLYDSLLSSP